MVIKVGNKHSFDVVIGRYPESPCIIAFYASWSTSARQMLPTIQYVETLHEQVIFMIVDVEESKALSEEFGVTDTIPLYVMWKGNKEVDRIIGGSVTHWRNWVIQHVGPERYPTLKSQYAPFHTKILADLQKS